MTCEVEKLISEERSAEGLVATAAAAVFPFHLDHPVVTAKGLVKPGAVGSSLGRTELEVAFVGIFLAAGVKPGIQVRVGDSFFGFVRDHVAHAVRAAYANRGAVGAGGLNFATIRALIHVSYESVLDIRSANGRVGVEAAIGPAEA